MGNLDCSLCILCGGLGTRIQEIAGDTSKSMLNINGQPLLLKVILNAWDQGAFEKTLLLAGHKSESIVELVEKRNNSGEKISIVVEERPLGTGGAIINALDKINTSDFVVINGDTLTDFNIHQFISRARKIGASCAIGGIPVDNMIDYGALEINPDGTLAAIHEKQRSGPGIANCGIVYFTKSLFEKLNISCSDVGTISLESDILAKVICKIYVFVDENTEFLDVGTPERFLKAVDKY